MKVLLQGFYLSLFACLLFSSCSSSLYTSNGARDQRPLLFDGEYDIEKLGEIKSTGKAFWGIPISQKKYKRKSGSIGVYFNGISLMKTPKILPILTLLTLDFAFTSYVMQPIFGEKTETITYDAGTPWEYSYTISDGNRLGLVPGLLLSLPFAGTINNFIWSGATAEASSTIERQLIDKNPDIDLFFFPKYEVKKYNVFNDGVKYLWWQEVDVDARVKGATIKLTE